MITDPFIDDAQEERLRWQEANRAYLETSLQKLRLLLRRQVTSLRAQWSKDPLSDYRELVVSDEQADELLAGEALQPAEPDARDQELTVKLGELEETLRGQTEAAEQGGAPPVLEVLTNLFDLTSFEKSVLVLCVAPEYDPGFERLYAYVQNDVQRKYATAHLALTLFRDEPGASHTAFQSDAPLRRFRLVTPGPALQAGTPRASRPLHLDERIADYLRGTNLVDQNVDVMLSSVAATPLSPAQNALAGRVAAALRDTAAPARVQLLGRRGTGRASVAAAIARDLGFGLAKLDVDQLPAPGPERQELLSLLTREATLLQLAYYIETDELATATAFAKDVAAPLIIATDGQLQAEPPPLAVRVPTLNATEQWSIWLEALGTVTTPVREEVDRLVQQFNFGAREIVDAVASARWLARLRPADEVSFRPSDLWEACRKRSGLELAALAQRIEPCYDWEDLVLPDDARSQLDEITAQIRDRGAVYEEWGFGEKLNRGRGISALFSGRSGTGKTMAAEILAKRLELDLYRIDLAGVVSKYIGETEKNLKRIFDAAERSGAILFFDEADALFGKRSRVSSSHDRYANIEINYLLQRMEDYRGLAILATNRKADLDGAFLRRLRFVVEFPFPDSASRLRIWEGVFPPHAPLEDVDFRTLATLEIAGGSIRNIAVNGAFLAKADGEPIRMDHLREAMRREYAKLEKLMSPSQLDPRARGYER